MLDEPAGVFPIPPELAPWPAWNVLFWLVFRSPYDLLLEKDLLRVVPREESRKHWTKWWKETQAKIRPGPEEKK